jgi:mycoredoxin-dependent peroxiredoxin
LALEIGTVAPDFTLTNQHGEPVTLSEFRGSKDVMVVFYPFAFSGVCSDEMAELRDAFAELSGDTTELLAISCDPIYALRAYADRDGYQFSLLSDFWPHGEVARSYGAFNLQRGCAGRLTVLVDRRGTVSWQVETAMGSARNVDDYRSALSMLQRNNHVA